MYNPRVTQVLLRYCVYVTHTKVALGTFLTEKGLGVSNRRCLLHLIKVVLTLATLYDFPQKTQQDPFH